MTEANKKVFIENLQLFLQFWGSREPIFISYFKQNYALRTGELFNNNYNNESSHKFFKFHTFIPLKYRKMGTFLQTL